MDNPTGNIGLDVDTTFNGTCTNVRMNDTSGNWTITVPFDTCNIAQNDTADIKGIHHVKHALYWNSQWPSFPQLYQADQVELLCRVDSTNLTSTSISVGSNTDMMSKDETQTISIKDVLVLSVLKGDAGIDEFLLNDIQTSSTVLGQNMNYAQYDANTGAKIGDPMRLKLDHTATGKETFERFL